MSGCRWASSRRRCEDLGVELRGDRVRLRALSGAEVGELVALLNETAVAQWWSGYDRERVESELVGRGAGGAGGTGGTTVYGIDVDGELAGVIQSS